MSALISITAAITRHHLIPIPYINIMRDREFMAANHVMTGIVKTLKREGADKTNHHPPISKGDLQKMYSLLYARCGLKSCCISIRGVVKGCATSLRRHSSSKKRMTVTGSITPYNEADRTHHVVDYRESLKDTRMYAMPGNELCPVQVIGTSRTLRATWMHPPLHSVANVGKPCNKLPLARLMSVPHHHWLLIISSSPWGVWKHNAWWWIPFLWFHIPCLRGGNYTLMCTLPLRRNKQRCLKHPQKQFNTVQSYHMYIIIYSELFQFSCLIYCYPRVEREYSTFNIHH